jgi:hypothetical protein
MNGTRTCTIPDCDLDSPYYAKGYCRKHYDRIRSHGAPDLGRRKPNPDQIGRLLSHTRREGDCLVWTARRNTSGYGQMQTKDFGASAHRHSYRLFKGDIPEGMVVRHTCDNPPCVNPEHLIVGTDADNIRDRDTRNRTARGQRNGGARLSWDEVLEIRNLLDAGHLQQPLADRFGVGQTTISRIKRRTHWVEEKRTA